MDVIEENNNDSADVGEYREEGPFIFKGEEDVSTANKYIFDPLPSAQTRKREWHMFDSPLPPPRFFHYYFLKPVGTGARSRAARIDIRPVTFAEAGDQAKIVSDLLLSDPSLNDGNRPILMRGFAEALYGEEEVAKGYALNIDLPECIEAIRSKIDNRQYTAPWKDLIAQTRLPLYFLPELWALPLRFVPGAPRSLFYFSVKQLRVLYRVMLNYPEAMCFSNTMHSRMSEIDPSLCVYGIDPQSSARHYIPEMDYEAWTRYIRDEEERLSKFAKDKETWASQKFKNAVKIYHNAMKKLLTECKNTFVTAGMIARCMGWEASARSEAATSALGYLLKTQAIVSIHRRTPDDPEFDEELDTEDRYALTRIEKVEKENFLKMMRFLDQCGECKRDQITIKGLVEHNSATHASVFGSGITSFSTDILDSDQRNAIQKMLNAPISLLTGPPGTGKTRVTAYLIKMFCEALYKRYPTGKDEAGNETPRFEVVSPTAAGAAQLRKYLNELKCPLSPYNQDVATVAYHATYYSKAKESGKQAKTEKDDEEEDEDEKEEKKKDAKKPGTPFKLTIEERLARYERLVKIIILDECSQVSAETARQLFDTFGSLSMLIMVGDMDQNFPVDWGKPVYDFQRLLDVHGLVIRLEKYHRQVGPLQELVQALREKNVEKVCSIPEIYTATAGAFDSMSFEKTRDGAYGSMVAVLQGGPKAPISHSTPGLRDAYMKQFLRQATSFVITKLRAGTEVRFGTFSREESVVVNRICKVYYQSKAGNFDSETMGGDDNWLASCNLHCGDRVMFQQNMNCCFSLGDMDTFNAKYAPAGTVVGTTKHIRTTFNGDTGVIVDVYVYEVSSKARQEFKARCAEQAKAGGKKGGTSEDTAPPTGSILRRGLKSTSSKSVGQLRGHEQLVIAVRLDRDPSTYLHVSMREYPRAKIDLAWASTAYKLQGTEWARVCYIVSNTKVATDREKLVSHIRYPEKSVFENMRTAYVALSRGRESTDMIFTNQFDEKIRTIMLSPEITYASVFGSLVDRERKNEEGRLAEEEEVIAEAEKSIALKQRAHPAGGEPVTKKQRKEEEEAESASNPPSGGLFDDEC